MSEQIEFSIDQVYDGIVLQKRDDGRSRPKDNLIVALVNSQSERTNFVVIVVDTPVEAAPPESHFPVKLVEIRENQRGGHYGIGTAAS